MRKLRSVEMESIEGGEIVIKPVPGTCALGLNGGGTYMVQEYWKCGECGTLEPIGDPYWLPLR